MQKIIIGVLLVLLAGAGWMLFGRGSDAALQEDAAAKRAAQNEATALSASMNCADGSHFVAEFPADDSLNILIDGNLVRKMPRVPGDGQRFEDSDYLYVFAGEEAQVTTKATQAITTCTQPFDANNAPMNFGDAGEGGGVKPDVSMIVGESIIGKWVSVDDAKFTREFKVGNVVTDLYDGKDATDGTSLVFTKDTAPNGLTVPLEENAAYMQLVMKGTPAETLNFKVGKLTPEELELVYLERGGVLRFTRAK